MTINNLEHISSIYREQACARHQNASLKYLLVRLDLTYDLTMSEPNCRGKLKEPDGVKRL